jgi:hypothetical protein
MRKLTAALCVGLLALGAAACTDSGDGARQSTAQKEAEAPVELQALELASARAVEEETVRILFRSHITTESLPEGLHATGRGAFDVASGLGEMTMTFDSASPVPGLERPMKMVLDDTVVYMKSALFAQALPDSGKSWIRIDLQAAGEEMGVDLAALQQVGGTNPTQSFDMLRGVRDVELVGRATVRGVETEHYTGVVDLDAVVEDAPADVRERVASTVEAMKEALGTDEMPIEAWIDDDGLVRRMVQDFTIDPSGGEKTTQEITMDFFGYGSRVDVDLPPPAKVVDIADLTG